MNPRAKKVKYKSPYRLEVVFSNNELRHFDLQPYLIYPVYSKLKDEAYCNKVKVKDGIVVWDEEVDMDPDRLYLESKIVSDAAV